MGEDKVQEKTINYNRVLRIALGSTISYALCSMLGLKYASSAAVITLLSIQDTKKATLQDSLKRVISYIVAIGLCSIFTGLLGYHIYTFLIFMLVFVFISFGMDWQSTLSSSTVVTTHFMMEQSFDFRFMLSELLLLVIGTGTAVCLNILLRDKSKAIDEDIRYIERDFEVLIRRFVRFIQNVGDEGARGDKDWLSFLKIHLDKSMERAFENTDNSFNSESHYYIEYLEMRLNQWRVLERIYDDLTGVDNGVELPLAEDICNILISLGKNLSKRYAYEDDRKRVVSLIRRFNVMELPKSRAEFTNMAVVADILNELEYFISLKAEFIKSLDEKQMTRYFAERTE